MGRGKRSEQCDPSEVCIVHAVQRCVRRAFLAGVDERSGRDYSHRREWIRRRMEALASVFGVDVLTYAVMSNHLHLVLRNRPDVVAQWSDQEVAIRWLRVFPGRRLEEYLAEPTESDVTMLVNQPERLTKIRTRLSDISWFMRALSEPIARMANRQDECTGRFWEGRFKAQRIADEAGLLACAMYVDLNPIRAAMAESIEASVHTSAYDRLQASEGATMESAAFDLVPVSNEQAAAELKETPVDELRQQRRSKQQRGMGRRVARDEWLAPLTLQSDQDSLNPVMHAQGIRASDKGFLSLGWGEYLELLRWTAMQRIGEDVRQLPARVGAVLTKLGIDAGMWRDFVWNFKRYFGRSSCAGSPAAMAADAATHGRRWHHGQRRVSECFASS